MSSLQESPVTAGEWQTEEDSREFFDNIVEASGLFRIYREVRGYYDQPREGQERKDPRIDRILSPTKKLLEHGWTLGPVGVECKTSGVKIGPLIAQAMDYRRAVWYLPKGYRVKLSRVFIWPVEKQHGPLASVLAQQQIGTAISTKYAALRLACGEIVALHVEFDGRFSVGSIDCGKRAGSR